MPHSIVTAHMRDAPDFETATALIDKLAVREAYVIKSQADLLGAVALGLYNGTIAGHVHLAPNYLGNMTTEMAHDLGLSSAPHLLRHEAMRIAWAGRLLERAYVAPAEEFPLSRHFMEQAGLERKEVEAMDAFGLGINDLRLLQLAARRVRDREIGAYFHVGKEAIVGRKKALWIKLGSEHQEAILSAVPPITSGRPIER